eukprot:1754086-Amphidinium_carterae.4
MDQELLMQAGYGRRPWFFNELRRTLRLTSSHKTLVGLRNAPDNDSILLEFHAKRWGNILQMSSSIF